jgi:hypothetical protein
MEIKLYKSYWKSIKIVALTLPFLILTILFPEALPTFLYWFLIIFSGLGIIAGMAHLFDRRPQLIINEAGIYERSYNELFKWSSIEDAHTLNIHGQKFICLLLNENYQPKKSTKFRKGVIKLTKKIGGQEINLPYGQLDVNESKLLELFRIKLQTATTNESEE